MAFWYKKGNKRPKFKSEKSVRKGYLIDAYFDGRNECGVLVFLDPDKQETFKWFDNTDHKPYLLTDATIKEVEDILSNDSEYIGVEEVTKYDLLTHSMKRLRKVYSINPRTIGGRYDPPSYRTILQNNGFNVWEAWIRYHHNYIYDMDLVFGMPYKVTNDRIIPMMGREEKENMEDILDTIVSNDDVEMSPSMKHWIKLFETELPEIKKCVLDIEVKPDGKKIPDPDVAKEPLLCISVVTSDGRRIVIIIEREDYPYEEIDIDAQIILCRDERTALKRLFNIIKQYPVVITFNGDHFDLTYLYNRALNLGIGKYNIPLYGGGRNKCDVTDGVHVDLYKFFRNESVKNYAFKAKYKHNSLDDISLALLGEEKIHIDKPFMEYTYEELAKYCLRDSVLTYKLATFDGNKTLNLLYTLTRMANLPIVDVCRYRISTWIKSTFYFFHRRRDILIPTTEELKEKGEIETEATIKGKRYQGAIVREPKPGVHFEVKVMDYQSLYPSEIKERNICYSTVNCEHEECNSNKVPYTSHHICIKFRGITSEIIGSLRDTRVYYYKPMARRDDIDPVLKAFYEVFEQAIKVFLNASYGVVASEHFLMFCPVVAEIVTAWGRFDMSRVADKALEMGIDVFYGDTDSIFLGRVTDEQVNELTEWAHDELHLDLGVDKVYKVAFFSERKKNYLGVYEDRSLDKKGLVGMKSNTPPIVQEAFNKITNMLSKVDTMEDVEKAKEDIIEIGRNYHNRIKNRDFGLEELSFNVTLGSSLDEYETNPQHVKAAKMMRERGVEIEKGQVISFVKADNEEGVLPVDIEVVSGLDAFVDRGNDTEKIMKGMVKADKYNEQLRTALEQVLDALNIDYDRDIIMIKQPKPQNKLDAFMI